MAIRPLTDADLNFWRPEIKRARDQRKTILEKWDVTGNLARYAPPSVVNAEINVAKDFSDVERKKAALFYDTPTIALSPDPETNSPALLLHQEVLNGLLSTRELNAKATILRVLQDVLVAVQPGGVEVGYHAVTVDAELPAVEPPPLDPAIPAIGDPVPVTVHERFFCERISPAAILLPSNFLSTDYDAALWMGYEWRKPTAQIRRQYHLPEDWQGGEESDQKPYFDPTDTQGDRSHTEPMTSGVTIWYRAHLVDPTVKHPEVMRRLVLADGKDHPLEHGELACQEIGPDGKLTPRSMRGYPLHLLALRDLPDSPWVPSDCTITAPLTQELNLFRQQMVERRDASRQHVLYDAEKINEDVRQKIEQNTFPTMIPVEPGALSAGKDSIMTQLDPLALGRESYEGQNIIERDRAQVLGIDANQAGAQANGKRTATEISTVQRNTDARFEQERQRVLEWWIGLVQKLSALTLKYGDGIVPEILGPQRAQMWLQARDQGQFDRFRFDVLIDSGKYVDIEARKRQDLQLYNLTAKDPMAQRMVVLKRLGEDFGLDVSQWLVTQPPEAKPEPPKVNFAFSAQDLNPLLPTYAATYVTLTQLGIKDLPPPLPVPVQDLHAGQEALPPPFGQRKPDPEHPGAAEKGERLDQHQMDESGDRSGPKV